MNKKIKAMQKDIDYLLEVVNKMTEINDSQIKYNQKIFDILQEMENNES